MEETILLQEDGTDPPLNLTSLLAFLDAQRKSRSIVKDAKLLDVFLVELENILMDASRSDTDKFVILVFLSEHCCWLLTSPMQLEKVCAVLNDLLYQEFSSEVLKCEILSTLTTIVVSLDVFASQVSALETLVEVILSFADTVNQGETILLRSSAAGCLIELEETYPLLLASHLGHILQWTLKDTSLASQSYAGLLHTTLYHKLLELSESELHSPRVPQVSVSSAPSSGELETDEVLFAVLDSADRFSVPPRYRPSTTSLEGTTEETKPVLTPNTAQELNFESVTAPLLGAAGRPLSAQLAEQVHLSAVELQRAVLTSFSPRALKATRRALLALAENIRLFTPSYAASIALRISSMMKVSDLKRELLNLRFGHFINCGQPVLVHAALMLSRPADWSSAECSLAVQRCASRISDSTQSDPLRSLYASWLRELLAWSSFAASVVDHRRYFVPSIFDTLLVQEWRLHTLCAASAFSSPIRLADSLLALRVLYDTRVNSTCHTAFLRILWALLVSRSPTLEHVAAVCTQLEQRILVQPELASLGITVIKQLMAKNRSVFSQVRGHIASFFVNEVNLQNNPRFVHCVPLVQLLIRSPSVRAEDLMQVLLNFVRNSTICELGTWSAGTSLLDVAHQVLLEPEASDMSRELTSTLLSLLEAHFHHVDVRDRAHMYYVLATHLESRNVIEFLDTSRLESNNGSRRNHESKGLGSHSRATSSSSMNSLLGESDALSAELQRLVRISRTWNDGNDRVMQLLEKTSTPTELARSQNGSNFDEFTIPFSLDFSLDDLVAKSSHCTRVYSVSATFTALEPALAAGSSTIHVPTLVIGRTERKTLVYTPKAPLPSTLQLPNLELSFTDLLVPFSRDQDFETLWKSVMVDERSAESVRVLAVERALVLRRIESLLHPFVIQRRNDDEDCHWTTVGCSLLPKDVLLLKFTILARETHIELRTSTWRLLAFVDTWLDSLLTA